MSRDPGVAAFVFQNAAFSAIQANENGYLYGQLPPGHTYERSWVRLDRPRCCSEWQERRLVAEWLDETAEQEREKQ